MIWDWLWNIPMAIGKNAKGYSLLIGGPFEWWVEIPIPKCLYNKLDHGWNRRLERTFKR